jgi:hypothetical protein
MLRWRHRLHCSSGLARRVPASRCRTQRERVPSREGERTGAAWRKRSRAATEAALRTVRTDSFTGNDTRLPRAAAVAAPTYRHDFLVPVRDGPARLAQRPRAVGATAPRGWRDGPAGVARRPRGCGAAARRWWRDGPAVVAHGPRGRCVQLSMHVRPGGRGLSDRTPSLGVPGRGRGAPEASTWHAARLPDAPGTGDPRVPPGVFL